MKTQLIWKDLIHFYYPIRRFLNASLQGIGRIPQLRTTAQSTEFANYQNNETNQLFIIDVSFAFQFDGINSCR